MLRRVTLRADRSGNLRRDVLGARVFRVESPGPVAHLTLDVSERLLGIAESVPMPGAESNDMAGDATRLKVPVHVEKGLVSAGVLGGAPLLVLRLVTLLTSLRTE